MGDRVLGCRGRVLGWSRGEKPRADWRWWELGVWLEIGDSGWKHGLETEGAPQVRRHPRLARPQVLEHDHPPERERER